MVRNILVSTGDKEPLCNALRILITAEILTYQLLNTHTQFVSAPSKEGRDTGGYCMVFENDRKSLIQHCERIELLLHFE